MTEYFRVFQDGEERGRGMIDPEGDGYLQLAGKVYQLKIKQPGEAWNGQHERLPEQGARAEQDIPF